MNMLNMIFKTKQLFEILLFCVLSFKAGGLKILTNVSTKVNESVGVDNIMDYTTDINRYNVDLGNMTSLLFEIKTCKTATVLLSNSDVRNSSIPLYRIIIKNSISFISYNVESQVIDYKIVATPYILNCIEYLPFWVSWADGDIKLGTGVVVGENIVMQLTNTEYIEVKYIGVLSDHSTSGKWRIQIEVSDRFAGYFDSCRRNDTRSDTVKSDDIKSSKLRCARNCGESKDCMGFNFHSAMHRCELLSFGSNVVTDIPNHIEAGWRFYSKCFNVETACLGCYF